MTAKDFFEQNRGKYFKYSDDVVRVVGYNDNSILTARKKGWNYYKDMKQGIKYIDESLINKEDKLWFADIEQLTNIEQPELDLCKLLEGCEGIKLYSPIFGDVVLTTVNDALDYPIEVTLSNRGISNFNNNGLYLNGYNGECMLFPSKENRDWSTFKKPNKIKYGTPVMCKMFCAFGWSLRKFDEIITNYKWIVPVSEFDFSDFDSNKSKSII